jgi:hypothetical protein
MSAHLLVPQERDRIRGRRVFALGGAGVLITVISVVVANAVGGGAAERVSSNARAGTRPLPATVGTVEQSLVRETARGVTQRTEQTAALERWGWVDRDAGVATIPIDRAIDVVVERSR